MYELWDTISQIGVSIFGITAIVLVAKKNKWGFVFGLASQPFWFITSFINQQWGVLLLCFMYTATWLYGVDEWFFNGSYFRKIKDLLVVLSYYLRAVFF
jgi:nicotinamide riboside transporter PnuC